MRWAFLDPGGVVIGVFDGHPDDWPDLRDAGRIAQAGPEVMAGWVWDGAAFAAPPPASGPRVISPLEFRRRFTPAERSAITVAAAVGVMNGFPTLKEFMDDLSSAGEVDLNSPDLREGVDLLVWAELLTPERAAAILAI